MLQTRQRYSIQVVTEEVQSLVARGVLDKKTQLYSLSRYFNDQDWQEVECILTLNEYLLRDSISDLLGPESWAND
ncbi:MAG: DUF4327 family protein [Phormidesmis sp.]